MSEADLAMYRFWRSAIESVVMRPAPNVEMALRGLIIVTLALCLAAAVAAPFAPEAAAQGSKTGKVWRIGYLAAGSPPPPSAPPSSPRSAFLQGLRELGYVDGQHIMIESRWSEGRLDRLPDLAAELVNLRVSVIYASSLSAALAAKQATSTIPIVFVTLGDPVAAGLVSSLARPGGNLTGLGGGEVVAKRLQLLKDVAPDVTRVAVLLNPRNPGNLEALKRLRDAARLLGVQLHPQEVSEPAGLSNAFTAMTTEHVGALLVVADPTFVQHHRLIVDFAMKSRLPASYAERQYVDAGGLISYQTNLADLNRRAAGYVDKILKGAKPGSLPVELPTKFELLINLGTAKALGLTIPPSLLVRADHVID
jgi:putative ABC transport system substrate-binding protein